MFRETTSKGDYKVVNERGYQQLIDEVYSYLTFGPKEYNIVKTDHKEESLKGMQNASPN
jgi:hypothetical protein